MIEGKQIVAVGGGKGGVGKSVVATNLAVAFAQSGAETILVDADLGAPNLHTMLGVERPVGSLGDVLSSAKLHLADVISHCSVDHLSLVCGAGPILGVANPQFQKKQRLIREIQRLDAEMLVVDLGAGVSYNVLDFFNAADVRLVVVTPQLTSMHNAYGFVKSALHRLLQRAIAGKPGYNDLFGRPGWAEEKLDQLLERVAMFDPRYLDVFEPLVDSFSVILLGNLIEQRKEINVLWAMRRMVRDFLRLECKVVGSVWRDDAVRRSVNRRWPFMLEKRSDANAQAIRDLSTRILTTDPSPERAMREMALETAKGLPKTRDVSAANLSLREQLDALDEERFATELLGRQRSEPRYAADLRVMLRLGEATREARLTDLSRSGARIVEVPEVSSEERIEIRLPRDMNQENPSWFWVPAVVRRYDAKTSSAGCQLQASEVAQKALNELVAQLADADTSSAPEESIR